MTTATAHASIRDSKFTNNTFVANNRDFSGANQPTTDKPLQFWGVYNQGDVTGLAIKNNIFANHQAAAMKIKLHAFTNVDIDYNLYHNERFMDYVNSQEFRYLDINEWRQILQNEGSIQGNDKHSIEADPAFVKVPATPMGNHTAFDFNLKETSPAFGRGGALTQATATDQGKVIPVADAGYFCDGFKAIEGDTIQVNGKVVTVKAVDYTQNSITLSEAVSYSEGTEIFFGNSPATPNIGATPLFEMYPEVPADTREDIPDEEPVEEPTPEVPPLPVVEPPFAFELRQDADHNVTFAIQAVMPEQTTDLDELVLAVTDHIVEKFPNNNGSSRMTVHIGLQLGDPTQVETQPTANVNVKIDSATDGANGALPLPLGFDTISTSNQAKVSANLSVLDGARLLETMAALSAVPAKVTAQDQGIKAASSVNFGITVVDEAVNTDQMAGMLLRAVVSSYNVGYGLVPQASQIMSHLSFELTR